MESVCGIFSFFIFEILQRVVLCLVLCCVDIMCPHCTYCSLCTVHVHAHLLDSSALCLRWLYLFFSNTFVHFKPSVRAASARLWCFISLHFNSLLLSARYDMNWKREEYGLRVTLSWKCRKERRHSTFTFLLQRPTISHLASYLFGSQFARHGIVERTKEHGVSTLVNTDDPCTRRLSYSLIGSLLSVKNAS